MRRALTIAALLLTASFALAQEKEPAVVTKTRKQLEDLKRQVAETRGEKFTKEVKVGAKNDDEFLAFVKKDVDQDLPAEKSGKLSRAYQRIGLLPAGYDLRQGYLDAVLSQALAFYDPKTSSFYLVKVDAPDVVVMPGMFHELCHALQDQRFDLKKYYEGAEKDNDDAATARRFVVEGEAQFATTLWQLKQQGMESMLDDLLDRTAKMSRQELSQMQRQQAGMLGVAGEVITKAQDISDKLPVYIYRSLVDPYLKGTNMIAKVHKKGGWEAVDELFAKPPASTAQCLHVKKLREREAPVTLTLPDLGPRLEGAAQTCATTLGELGVACLLEQQGLAGEDAEAAAKGWRGDRLVAYEKPGAAADGSGTVAAWLTTWESPESAKRFADALRKLGDKGATLACEKCDVAVVAAATPGTSSDLPRAVLDGTKRK